jgi:hypothetical protein
MKGPDFWVGQTIVVLGKVVRFHDPTCEVRRSGQRLQSLFYHELMAAASVARQGSGFFWSLAISPVYVGALHAGF